MTVAPADARDDPPPAGGPAPASRPEDRTRTIISPSAAQPPTGEIGVPSSRTRSAWQLQLILGLGMLIVVFAVLTLQPEILATWTFTLGLAILILTTAATLTIPWQRLPPAALLSVPLIDIVAIALLSEGNDSAIRTLWLIPIMWIASFFRASATVAALALVGIAMIATAPGGNPFEVGLLRFLTIMVGFTLVAIVAANAGQQTRAFKRLLRRQASRLTDTLARVLAHEQQLSLVLNSVDVGIARLSAAGDVTFANDTYRALFELDKTAPGAPHPAVQYSEFRGSSIPAGAAPLARAAAGEEFHDLRTWLFDSRGQWHALSTDARRLRGAPDEGDGAIVIVKDITTMLQAERARDTIASTVSHELRNPLTAVLGYADMALDDTDLRPAPRRQFEMIQGAAERMQHLINDLLRGASDAAALQPGPAGHETCDFARICRESVTSFAPWAAERGVSVNVTGPHPLPVIGDEFQLRQVVDNLVSNAIKYSHRNGRVTLSLRVVESAAQHRIVLVIADDGIGIAPADVERIFDPYFRAQEASDGDETGTGLGLSIVRDIVREHGGDITVRSEPGIGTEMTVRLLPGDDAGGGAPGGADAAEHRS
ncbi:ATP-binding protein [Microbacterium sp. NPDC078428]|uniref:ATP-binding protein n=1 Tax=Microbacterium sp. NPDC078428 TaxID=3364190 RepID=UPI0037CAFBE6